MNESKSLRPTPKSRVVSFRLSNAEFTRIAHRAAAANLRIGDLARQLVLARTDKIRLTVQTQSDPALLAQLNRIGVNLNQLVKNAHNFGRVSPDITRTCKTISDLIDHALEKEKT